MKKNRKFMSILLALSVAIAGCPAAYTAADTTTQTENTSDYGRKPDDSVYPPFDRRKKIPDHVEQ